MNKRARMRLIGVSAVILLLALAGYFTLTNGDNQANKTVKALLGDKSLVGQRVKVAGTVVDDSWDGKANPIRFAVRDDGDTKGPQLKVVYGGVVPSAFGNQAKAILTGTLGKDGVFQATDMLTQCPSKYAASAAETVDMMLSQGSTVVGKPMKVIGFVATDPAGGKFTLQDSSAGGKTVVVSFFGTPSPQLKKGAQATVAGSLAKSGEFDATNVAIQAPGK
jgi:cytochrome c-type biogenesis protein CcmE